jgi:hypothetical protein
MTSPVLALLSSIVLLVASMTRPDRASCPPGFALTEGVRADGRFTCHAIPSARWTRGPRGGWVDVSPDDNDKIESRVYCTGGTRPVVVRGVAVSCQRGGWR